MNKELTLVSGITFTGFSKIINRRRECVKYWEARNVFITDEYFTYLEYHI